MIATPLRQDAATPEPRHRIRPAGRTTRTLQVEALKRLIEQHASGGVRRGGHIWAALPQPVLLTELNAILPGDMRIGLRTLQDLIRGPGIVRRRALVDGKVRCLLRLGEVDQLTPEQDATERCVRIMARMWKNRTSRVPSSKGYGCIRFMVEAWTPDLAPAVLRCVLADWSRFMAGVKCDPGWVQPRFLAYPSLSVIFKFRHVAVDCHQTFVVEPGLIREEGLRNPTIQ